MALTAETAPTPATGTSLTAATHGSAPETVLRATDVQVAFGPVVVLPGASLEVRRGEVHLLIGPNGAGKTTFANAVTGHAPMSGGTIELAGQPLHGSIDQRARLGIGRKFQVPRVFARLNAADNVMVAERRMRRTSRTSGTFGASASGDVDLLEGIDPVQDVGTLSHGQRQRLELQMALSQGPALAVLDEPTAGMTRTERDELAALIRSSAGRQTFLIVEHDMDFVEAVADRVSFLRDGVVVVTGTFAEIAAHPEVRAAYLGETTTEHAPPRAKRADTTHGALEVRGLTVFHGKLASVRDVDLTLRPGGSLGVIGRNGAGKTTLLDGLMGSLRSEGQLTLDGRNLGDAPDWARARAGIAIVPQGKQLFKDLTVADNLRLAELGERGPGRAFDIHELFPAIRPLLARKAGLLSGGEQQQVAIARALLRRPHLLLLDEPTEGISPIVIQEITAVLAHLVAEGLSLVLADQHRSLIEALCDEFVVLRSGELAAGGAVSAEAFDHYDQRL